MNSCRKNTVDILGVRVGTQNAIGLVQYITHSIERGERIIIAYINIYTINLSQKLPWFKDYLNHASKTYCDGYGVKLGALLLGQHISERYTAPDWLPMLAADCARDNYTMYILGARPGVAERAAKELINKYPDLQILSTHHGYFDTTSDSLENEDIIRELNSHKIDILLLGLGTPLQEKWILENWDRLNCRVALPVGAALDYLAGDAWRAPRWMTDHGFEWLGRLMSDPGRLWKRYLLGIPNFFFLVIRQRYGYYQK